MFVGVIALILINCFFILYAVGFCLCITDGSCDLLRYIGTDVPEYTVS